MEATDTVCEVARETGTEARQIERHGRHRVTIHSDLAIEMARELLADVSGVSTQSALPGVFVYGDLVRSSAQ